MTEEPKLDRKFLEETMSERADRIEEMFWRASPHKELKRFADFVEFLDEALSTLSMTAALAIYCLENDLGRDFYEKASSYLRSAGSPSIEEGEEGGQS